MEEVRLEDNEILKRFPEELQKVLINQINESKIKNKKRENAYKEARELHDSGLGRRRIAKILGYPATTIESWLYGNSKPTSKISISLDTLLELKNVGLTNKEIGKLLSIHPFTVLRRIKPRKIRENKTFQMSKGLEAFIKTTENPVRFIKYFWLDSSKNEIGNFKKFCNFIKLKDNLKPFKLSREVGKSYPVIYNWGKGKDFPRLVRWLEIFINLGKPKRNFLWLPINLGSSGIPLIPIIQVPKKVNSWKDIETVIIQLNSNEILPTMTKEECFGFVLGMVVGDTSKPKAKRDSLALKLSKKYATNKILGDFFCKCLQKLGLEAHEIKDEVDKYRWLSQSSPLLSWVYTLVLGLEKQETTTYDSIKADWILNSPKNFQKRFLQGIFESDGSVSYGGTIDCSVYPNSELVKKLLATFGIKSYIILDRKWKKLIINNSDNKKCYDILFTPEIKTERYKRLERLVNAKRLKKGDKLPNEVRNEMKELIKSGTNNYKIIKQVLLKTGYFISPFRIERYKRDDINS